MVENREDTTFLDEAAEAALAVLRERESFDRRTVEMAEHLLAVAARFSRKPASTPDA